LPLFAFGVLKSNKLNLIMITLIFIVLLILFFSALINSVEAAILSTSLSEVKIMELAGRHGAKNLLRFKEKIQLPIIVLVVLINIINIGGSVLIGVYSSKIFGDFLVGVFSAVFIFLVILFAEIIPKNFGVRHHGGIALAVAPILGILIKFFTPFIWLVSKTTPLKIMGGSLSFSASEEEIKLLTITGAKSGAIEEDEAKMIQGAFRLNDITVADIMTPRPLTFWLDGNKSLEQKGAKIAKCPYSRILVCDGEIDKVMGICHKDDLLQALIEKKDNVFVKEFVSWVLFVPETRGADDLLRDFQKTKSHFAVAVNEYGQVGGIVTREDILQELVGELISEKDIAPGLIKRISKNEILAHGQTKLSYINHFFNINLKGGLTLNGYLLKKFEKFPEVGESSQADNIKFIIEEKTEKSIEKVRIIKT